MKVFLSHSSKDKWAARLISRELESLGVTAFLDEKDIASGASIDGAIREHLADSDHFLLLLSPASLKSEWVLLELGGALALGKVVVPILLYVSSNEIPQAINLKLARDINEIDRYYAEVKALIAGKPKPAPKPPRVPRRRASKLRKGQRVRIATKEPAKIFRTEGGTDVYWASSMDKYLGQTAEITGVDEDGDYFLDVDDGKYAWAVDWLVPERAS